MTVHSVLMQALALLSTPDSWCVKSLAVDSEYEECDPMSITAKRWDAEGAIMRAAGDQSTLCDKAFQAASELAWEFHGMGLPGVNDYRGYQATINVLKAAAGRVL